MKAIVTGAAGFVGSHLVDRLLDRGDQVYGIDNFSTGHHVHQHPNYRLLTADLSQIWNTRYPLKSFAPDIVFHFAAHADVRSGPSDTRLDLRENTASTIDVCELMRFVGCKRIVFASTGSVYGEPTVFPTPENAPFPTQTSFYGASKAAAEGFLGAYKAAYGFDVSICRFVSMLGPRYSHGHVKDFVEQLRAGPFRINVLGDGKQRKDYLHVSDAVSATLIAAEFPGTYNVGNCDAISVDESLSIIIKRFIENSGKSINPRREYSGGERGWSGDSPHIKLDTLRLRERGWEPIYTIAEAISETVDSLMGVGEVIGAR